MASDLAAPQGPATAEAVVKKAPTARGALTAWIFTVVLFSAVALTGPFFAPVIHAQYVNTTVSFGHGELLGVGLALFAAALARWVVHDAPSNVVLQSLSIVGLLLVAVAIALVWVDAYEAQIKHSKALFFPPDQVVVASWILVGASFLCGAATEVAYAIAARPTPIRGG